MSADFSDFDRYCDEHNITPEEAPMAFAAWMHEMDVADDEKHLIPGCCKHNVVYGCQRCYEDQEPVAVGDDPMQVFTDAWQEDGT